MICTARQVLCLKITKRYQSNSSEAKYVSEIHQFELNQGNNAEILTKNCKYYQNKFIHRPN